MFLLIADRNSATITGTTEQQNVAERALEEGAFPLSHALHLYYRQQGNLGKAGEWKLTKSDWRALPEPALLNKAKTLRSEATPLATGAPAPGTPFGITTASVTAFGLLVDAYDAEIGKPTDARSDKKAMTGQLRFRYARLREILADIDGLMEMLRSKSEAHQLFVDGYFAARRIGGHSSPDEGNGSTPTPPTP